LLNAQTPLASIEFPLLQKQTPLGLVSDPKVPVVVHTMVGDVAFQFLIDTGADFSLAPRRLARQVGLDWEALAEAEITGVSRGAVLARVGALPLRVGNTDITVRCLFTDRPPALFLLGRADFLDRFRLTVDTQLRRIILTELP
jgi:predicted aspartyl protease